MGDELMSSHAARPRPPARGWLVLALIALVLLGGWLYWKQQRAEEQRQQELIDEGFTVARVLTSAFSKANALKVGALSGHVEVTTRDAGWLELFPSSQTVRLPFSVDYTLDVSQLDIDDYKWNPQTRTLLVRLPPVHESAQNIDESRVEVRDRDGIWISRNAQEKLNRYASRGAIRMAATEAAKPARKAQAEANAKEAVANLLQAPLRAAGLGDVQVVARFATEEGSDDPSYLDLSTPYNEAIAEAQRRRAAEENR